MNRLLSANIYNFILLSLLFIGSEIIFLGIKYFYNTESLDFSILWIKAIVVIGSIYIAFLFTNRDSQKVHLYTLLFYVLLSFAFSPLSLDIKHLLGYFFIIFSLFRITELPSSRNKKKVLFDSSLAVAAASYYVESYIYFLTVLFLVILLFYGRNIKNWLIPLVSIGIFWILLISWNILMGADGYYHYIDLKGLHLEGLFKNHLLLVIIIFLTGINIYMTYSIKFQKIKRHLWLNLYTLILTCIIYSNNSSDESYQELLILTFPLATSINYIYDFSKSNITKSLVLTFTIVICLTIRLYNSHIFL